MPHYRENFKSKGRTTHTVFWHKTFFWLNNKFEADYYTFNLSSAHTLSLSLLESFALMVLMGVPIYVLCIFTHTHTKKSIKRIMVLTVLLLQCRCECHSSPGDPILERMAANTFLSEDCLYLNVWTPLARNTQSSLLNVMIWIHGGGYFMGTSTWPTYDGRYLAYYEDVVVVSLNYRYEGLLVKEQGWMTNWQQS